MMSVMRPGRGLITTTRSERNTASGIECVTNTTAAPVSAAIREAAPDGIDVYFDNVGGETLDAVLPLMRLHGRIAVCGMVSQYNDADHPHGNRNLWQLVVNRLTMRGFITYDHPEVLAEAQAMLDDLFASGKLKPLENVRDGLERLPEAFIELMSGRTTGKTLVAHALHAVGPRASKKFVPISCAAYNDEVLAAKLFGPVENGLPAVEEARGGTLCLEDIEALSEPLQARLLAFIAGQGAPAETRIIAISNARGEGRRAEDSLRPDLFYRLSALKITLPPLRQRGEDILALFTRMTEQFADEYGCEPPQVTAQEAAQLLQAPWPGNVRQLINVAERAVLQNRRGSGSIASLLMADGEDSHTADATTTEGKPLKEYVESFEKMLLDNTMRRHKGAISAVMDELCLPRRTLNEKMAKYGLSRGDYL